MGYFGPKDLIRPEALLAFEQTGKYILEPKIDGIFAELTIGSPNQFISKNDNPIRKSLLDGLELLSFPAELCGSVFLCEVETGTEWATKRRRDRGHTLLWIHSIIRLGSKLYRDVPYLQNKQKLQEIYNSFNPELKKRAILVTYDTDDFYRNYRRIQRDICYEGAVLKNITIGMIGENSQGKTWAWKKVKDFGFS